MTADDIRAAFAGDPNSEPVSRARMLAWMKSPDLETKAAIYHVLTTPSLDARVQPPLPFADRCGAIFAYLCRCIVEDPQAEWGETRYLAGHALAHWLSFWWHDGELDQPMMAAMRSQLAETYRSGDAGVRDGLLNGLLEHAFEDDDIAEFFADWRSDLTLKNVYEDALLWRATGDQAFAAVDSIMAEWAAGHGLRISKEGGGLPRRFINFAYNPQAAFCIAIEPPSGIKVFVDTGVRILDEVTVALQTLPEGKSSERQQARTVPIIELKSALEEALAKAEEWSRSGR
jgi:hypothetical protein